MQTNITDTTSIAQFQDLIENLEFERSKYKKCISQVVNETQEFEARSEKLSSEEQSLANQLDEIFAKTDLYKSLQEKNNENIKRTLDSIVLSEKNLSMVKSKLDATKNDYELNLIKTREEYSVILAKFGERLEYWTKSTEFGPIFSKKLDLEKSVRLDIEKQNELLYLREEHSREVRNAWAICQQSISKIAELHKKLSETKRSIAIKAMQQKEQAAMKKKLQEQEQRDLLNQQTMLEETRRHEAIDSGLGTFFEPRRSTDTNSNELSQMSSLLFASNKASVNLRRVQDFSPSHDNSVAAQLDVVPTRTPLQYGSPFNNSNFFDNQDESFTPNIVHMNNKYANRASGGRSSATSSFVMPQLITGFNNRLTQQVQSSGQGSDGGGPVQAQNLFVTPASPIRHQNVAVNQESRRIEQAAARNYQNFFASQTPVSAVSSGQSGGDFFSANHEHMMSNNQISRNKSNQLVTSTPTGGFSVTGVNQRINYFQSPALTPIVPRSTGVFTGARTNNINEFSPFVTANTNTRPQQNAYIAMNRFQQNFSLNEQNETTDDQDRSSEHQHVNSSQVNNFNFFLDKSSNQVQPSRNKQPVQHTVVDSIIRKRTVFNLDNLNMEQSERLPVPSLRQNDQDTDFMLPSNFRPGSSDFTRKGDLQSNQTNGNNNHKPFNFFTD